MHWKINQKYIFDIINRWQHWEVPPIVGATTWSRRIHLKSGWQNIAALGCKLKRILHYIPIYFSWPNTTKVIVLIKSKASNIWNTFQNKLAYITVFNDLIYILFLNTLLEILIFNHRDTSAYQIWLLSIIFLYITESLVLLKYLPSLQHLYVSVLNRHLLDKHD